MSKRKEAPARGAIRAYLREHTRDGVFVGTQVEIAAATDRSKQAIDGVFGVLRRMGAIRFLRRGTRAEGNHYRITDAFPEMDELPPVERIRRTGLVAIKVEKPPRPPREKVAAPKSFVKADAPETTWLARAPPPREDNKVVIVKRGTHKWGKRSIFDKEATQR